MVSYLDHASLRAFACTCPYKLTQASLAHSALFAGYYTYLSGNVAYHRCQTGTLTNGEEQSGTPLSRAVRAHGNFSEYTPFAFLLLFLAELNGAPTKWVHAAYVTLFLSRVSAGLGLTKEKANNVFRKFGFIGTLNVILGAGLYNVRLSLLTQFGLGYEPLKSFFGVQ